jgi:LacI family transcriptional regulator
MRVTLKDIAAEANVSVMTVSLVLRDQGRVGQETRERVKAIAKRLRYTPDPALSALVYHRRERQQVKAGAQIAFMTNFATEEGWRDVVYVSRYYEGAQSRATELGYSIENFWMKAPGMSPQRLCKILETRGIQGLLVAPIEEQDSRLTFAWDRFCSVSLCRNLVWPKINVVDHNHHHSIKLAWHELVRRGYRKIGLVVMEVSVAISDYEWLASHYMQQRLWHERDQTEPVEPLIVRDWSRADFEKWYAKEQPDVILTPHIIAKFYMDQMGLDIPAEVGFLHLEARTQLPNSGIWQNFFKVGVAAVDLLHLEIMRMEMGVPQIRQSVAIDGTWHEGETLRPPVEGD